jgi:hypothetical protein
MSSPTLGEAINAAAMAAAQGAAQGSKSQMDAITSAIYDVMGAYPRLNVLPYWYSFSATSAKSNALSGLGTSVQTIKVSADAPFIATKIVGASTGDYSAEIRISGSDRILMNEAVHSSALVGTAERPGILPKPLLIQANAVVTFNLTDLSNSTNEIYFSLMGFKIYNLDQAATSWTPGR